MDWLSPGPLLCDCSFLPLERTNPLNLGQVQEEESVTDGAALFPLTCLLFAAMLQPHRPPPPLQAEHPGRQTFRGRKPPLITQSVIFDGHCLAVLFGYVLIRAGQNLVKTITGWSKLQIDPESETRSATFVGFREGGAMLL